MMHADGCVCLLLLMFLCNMSSADKKTSESLCGICSCTQHKLDCSHRDLLKLPPLAHVDPKSILRLDLSRNKLEQVPRLNQFPNLEELLITDNEIRNLTNNSFSGLTKLKVLDLSRNLISFSAGLAETAAFSGLYSLTKLSIKQRVAPKRGYAYDLLTPLASLQELFMTGTEPIGEVFSKLTNLTTLSLGGSHCSITKLTNQEANHLTRLRLRKLSVRNCGVTNITEEFLQAFNATLEKLDISCNPLRKRFGDICRGLSNSPIRALIADNINQDEANCDWVVQRNDVESLKTTKLTILSAQANHFGNLSNIITLSTWLPYLQYLNVAQNSFGGASFEIIGKVNKIEPTNPTKQLFDIWFPDLRFLSLDSLTGDRSSCNPEVIPELLNCIEESELFMADKFDWKNLADPYIIDLTLMLDYLKDNHEALVVMLCLRHPSIDDVVNHAQQWFSQHNYKFNTPEAINSTIYYLTNGSLACGDNIVKADFDRVVPARLTQLSVQQNQFKTHGNKDYQIQFPVCSNGNVIRNNLQSIDLSGSSGGYLYCKDYKGLVHLKKLICRNCQITGWDHDGWRNFPSLMHVDFSSNNFSAMIQGDVSGTSFVNMNSVNQLVLAKIGDFRYFSNRDILSPLTNLTQLDLSDNRLTTWNVTLITNPKLIFLNLSFNRIAFIDDFYRQELSNMSNLTVDLSNNSVSCSCEQPSRGYMKWLLDNRKRLVKFDLYTCDNLEKTAVQIYLQTKCEKKIPGSSVALIAVLTSTVTLAILVGMGIIYLRRWSLFFKIYSTRTRNRSHDYACSLFASISECESSKLAVLESALEMYGICIKSANRSVLPGQITHSAVAKMVGECDRMALFLSLQYFKENLTRFEYLMMEQKGLENMILVTLTNELPLHALPQTICSRLKSGDYLAWPGGVCGGSDQEQYAFFNTLAERLKNVSNTDAKPVL